MNVLNLILVLGIGVLAVALMILVLMQSGRSAGLGSVGGSASNDNTYWSKNKGRSMEGSLEKYTKLCGAGIMILGFLVAIIF